MEVSILWQTIKRNVYVSILKKAKKKYTKNLEYSVYPQRLTNVVPSKRKSNIKFEKDSNLHLSTLILLSYILLFDGNHITEEKEV